VGTTDTEIKRMSRELARSLIALEEWALEDAGHMPKIAAAVIGAIRRQATKLHAALVAKGKE